MSTKSNVEPVRCRSDQVHKTLLVILARSVLAQVNDLHAIHHVGGNAGSGIGSVAGNQAGDGNRHRLCRGLTLIVDRDGQESCHSKARSGCRSTRPAGSVPPGGGQVALDLRGSSTGRRSQAAG